MHSLARFYVWYMYATLNPLPALVTPFPVSRAPPPGIVASGARPRRGRPWPSAVGGRGTRAVARA